MCNTCVSWIFGWGNASINASMKHYAAVERKDGFITIGFMMHMPRSLLLLLLFAFLPQVEAQQYIDFRAANFGTVVDVTVQIFAAENSHVSKAEVVPVPRNEAVWEGRTNPIGAINIPIEYLDGRRALIWARKGDLMAFFALGKPNAKIKLNMTLVMQHYRTFEIITKTKTGRPVEHIPVFAVDAISLASHHLS